MCSLSTVSVVQLTFLEFLGFFKTNLTEGAGSWSLGGSVSVKVRVEFEVDACEEEVVKLVNEDVGEELLMTGVGLVRTRRSGGDIISP